VRQIDIGNSDPHRGDLHGCRPADGPVAASSAGWQAHDAAMRAAQRR